MNLHQSSRVLKRRRDKTLSEDDDQQQINESKNNKKQKLDIPLTGAELRKKILEENKLRWMK